MRIRPGIFDLAADDAGELGELFGLAPVHHGKAVVITIIVTRRAMERRHLIRATEQRDNNIDKVSTEYIQGTAFEIGDPFAVVVGVVVADADLSDFNRFHSLTAINK
ncbi:hypothetical protein [Thalassobacterium maritimum]|uniref:hypothetical protein n=1 Tax=Thalassobacterium maritimum TaxID=3041265 RepID=UPI0028121661|nr:hypothetical protein [Coraliomargarita sp. SDUM461003]